MHTHLCAGLGQQSRQYDVLVTELFVVLAALDELGPRLPLHRSTFGGIDQREQVAHASVRRKTRIAGLRVEPLQPSEHGEHVRRSRAQALARGSAPDKRVRTMMSVM